MFVSLKIQKLSYTGCNISDNVIDNVSEPPPLITRMLRENIGQKPISYREFEEIKRFTDVRGNIFEYENGSYKFVMDCRIYLERKCVEITDEELNEYPLLRKWLKEAEKEGTAKFHSSEWDIQTCKREGITTGIQ